jgi:GT2 family glycosyltransferase
LRLHYGDNTIQHSGIVAISRDGKNFGVTHHGLKSYHKYYDYRDDVLGNTAALMMTPKYLFERIGGFNEKYIECLEDVEYNIQCILNNKKNIFIGNAVAYHYESQTRNDNPTKDENYLKDWSERLKPLMVKNEKIMRYINKF